MFLSKKQVILSSYKNKSRRTAGEIALEKLLMDFELRYVSQKGWIAGDGFYISDFYLPKPHKICIEVDGGYHNIPKQKIRDAAKTKYLLGERGLRAEIRFSNSCVLNHPARVCRVLGFIEAGFYSLLPTRIVL